MKVRCKINKRMQEVKNLEKKRVLDKSKNNGKFVRNLLITVQC